jgi:hypothetical protein
VAEHDEHDPLLVAALLDREPPASERTAGELLVASCPECAELHAELVSLVSAAAALPAPERPRDFRLTEADAARLREPLAATARLDGEMHDTREHATHDTLLVAALADRTVPEPDRDRAEALIARCGLCRSLHADLLAIRTATIALPPATRSRDYTLTEADAVRLRPRGLRRIAAVFGSARDGFSRPLAIGLTTLGLAGLIAANIPSFGAGTTLQTVGSGVTSDSSKVELNAAATNPGSGTGAGAALAPVAPAASAAASAAAVSSSKPDYGTNRASAAAAPVASAAPPAPEATTDTSGKTLADAGASPSQDDTTIFEGQDAGNSPGATGGGTLGLASEPAGDNGISLLVIVSGTLLIAGLGLFALRWTSRRFDDD